MRFKKKDSDNSDGDSLDWDELYVFLISCTGWTWEYIDEYMTFPRLDIMLNYWDNSPPLQVAVNRIRLIIQSYFKINDKTGKRKKARKQTHDEFIQNFNEMAGIMGG